jgi:hypothetical protein
MVLLVTCLTVPASAGNGDLLSREYRSEKFGFSVRYPTGWRLVGAPTDAFHIMNFPRKKALRAVIYPLGGAGIWIATPSLLMRFGDEEPNTIEEWVKIGTRHSNVVSRRNVTLNIAGAPRSVEEVVTVGYAVPHTEAVEWYFCVEGRFFDAALEYWQGDPNALKLRQLLEKIVRTFKVLTTAPKDADQR